MTRPIKIISAIIVLLTLLIATGISVLSAIDFNQYKDLITEQTKAATGRDLNIAGDLKLSISFHPSVVIDGVTFTNATWGSRPMMFSANRFSAQMSLIPLLFGKVQINKINLEGVEVVAETNQSGIANWDFKGPLTDSHDTYFVVNFPELNQVSFKDITVHYKDARRGQSYLLKLNTVDLSSTGMNSPLEIKISGDINTELFSIDGQFGSLHAMNSAEMFPVDLQITALKMSIGAQGKLGMVDGNPSADLKLSIKANSLVETLNSLGSLEPGLASIDPPIEAEVKLTTQFILDGTTHIALKDLNATINSMRVKGQIVVDRSDKLPNIDVLLESGNLDFDSLAVQKKAQDNTLAGDTRRVFSAKPLPFDLFKLASARMKINIQKLIVDGIELSQASIDAALENGRLRLDPMEAIAGGGWIKSKVDLSVGKKTTQFQAQVEAIQLDYNELLIQRGLDNIASGKADLSIKVSSAGNSIQKLMAGLNGKIRAQTEGGQLESGALKMLSTDLLNFFDGQDDRIIRCGVLQFNIKQGKADSHALIFDTGGFNVLGTGGLNLRDETLNLRFEPRAKKTSVATVAMVPINLVGHFVDPHWQVDVAGAAGNIAAGAARTAGAISTLGLSLLIEKVATQTMLEPSIDFCIPALAGKSVLPGKMKAPTIQKKKAAGKSLSSRSEN